MARKTCHKHDTYIARLEQAQAEGDFEHVEMNLSRLRVVLAELRGESFELAALQERARMILARHG